MNVVFKFLKVVLLNVFLVAAISAPVRANYDPDIAQKDCGAKIDSTDRLNNPKSDLGPDGKPLTGSGEDTGQTK